MEEELALLKIKRDILMYLGDLVKSKSWIVKAITQYPGILSTKEDLWNWTFEQIDLGNPFSEEDDEDDEYVDDISEEDDGKDGEEEEDVDEENTSEEAEGEDFLAFGTSTLETFQPPPKRPRSKAKKPKFEKIVAPKSILCADCCGPIDFGEECFEVLHHTTPAYACTEECVENILELG